MSIYARLTDRFGQRIGMHNVFRYLMNASPMYRRSTGRIREVSKDLHYVKVRLSLNWKNRNYVNAIFGGSMFAAIDPIPMMQLTWILGKGFVVWDRSAEIRFKRPGRETLFIESVFTAEELDEIRRRVAAEQEIDVEKILAYKTKGGVVISEVTKVIYVADKGFYKEKRRRKGQG